MSCPSTILTMLRTFLNVPLTHLNHFNNLGHVCCFFKNRFNFQSSFRSTAEGTQISRILLAPTHIEPLPLSTSPTTAGHSLQPLNPLPRHYHPEPQVTLGLTLGGFGTFTFCGVEQMYYDTPTSHGVAVRTVCAAPTHPSLPLSP